MTTIIEKAKKIHTLPYTERIEPAIEIYNILQEDGYNDTKAKRVMRSFGFSRGLLFRLHLHKHLQYLSETPEQKPSAHSYNADM